MQDRECIITCTSCRTSCESSGKYDHEFIDYTIRVLRKCKEYGFRIYMDPHQDIVSVLTYSYFSSVL